VHEAVNSLVVLMDARASIIPSLPSSKPTVSYWQDPPHQLANHRSTSNLPQKVSTIVIGSGITGSLIAYNLLAGAVDQSSILLLEARTVCSGATGRNGGHTKCASYRAFPGNVKELGVNEAVKIVKFECKCMRAVHEFARDHGIDCDSWQGDTVDVIYDEAQWVLAQKSVAAMQKAFGDESPAVRYSFWNAQETEERWLCKGACGAVSYEAGSLSAYKFVCGALEQAMAKGLNLQTNTPAPKIEKTDEDWVVTTSRGSIHADKVVLATNGYTARLLPEMQGVIVPLRGHVTAHRPGQNMSKQGLSTTYSFIYTDGYDYMIPRPAGTTFDGDIVIGGGLTKAVECGLMEYGTTDDTSMDPTVSKYLEDSTPTFFGEHWGSDDPEGRVRKAWSGIMGYSADGFPFLGEVPGNRGLWTAASFQGHGMVLCFSAALAVTKMMIGKDGEELDGWLPKVYRITKERMGKRFAGRLHATAPKESGPV
jgi:glycine/D-amino acid oxidase-like deaminating enzyme